MTERLHFHFSLSCIGEGNGNPLQCCCLEDPRDREALWAAVCGVAQSRTRLKRLSSSSGSYYNSHLVTKEIGSERYSLWPGITQLENYPYFGLRVINRVDVAYRI